jgi:hypothetical protein
MSLTADWKGPKRQPGEPFEDYKKRRALENAQANRVCRGNVVWDPRRKGKPYEREKSEPGSSS